MSDAETTDIVSGVADASEPDRIAEATKQGWRPKEEYLKLKGADPERWVDHETFLATADKNAAIQRRQKEQALDRNRKLEGEMREMRDLVKDVLANQKADRERAIDEAIAKLKTEKREAIADADANKVNAIDQQIDKLKEAPKTTAKEPAKQDAVAGLPLEFVEWGKANPWINPKSTKHDPMMAGAAVGYYDLLSADPENEDLDDTEKLKLVSKEMRKRFPEKFSNPKRSEASMVEGGNGAAPRGNGKKSFADLPPEAQAMCDRLVKQKVLKSRDAYVADYPW